MTHPNKQEQPTDEQITAFIAETIQTFNDLAPSQRREVRNATRNYWISDPVPIKRLGIPMVLLETQYDNLDFVA
jgi:hypothetical protein